MEKPFLSDEEKIACDYYIVNQNKSKAYNLYRKLKGKINELSPDSLKSQAGAFFKKENISEYVIYQINILKKRYNNIDSNSLDIIEHKQDKLNNYNDCYDLSTLSKEEIRKFALKNLESEINNN